MTSATIVAALALAAYVFWQPAADAPPPGAGPADSSKDPAPTVQQESAPQEDSTPTESGPVEERQEVTPEQEAPVAKTFTEQLKDIILSMRDRGGVPKESVYKTPDKVDDVSKNPAYNPNGKELTIEQRIELSKLIKEINEAHDNAGDVWREANIVASLKAVDLDQVVRIDMGRTGAENHQLVQEAKAKLSRQLGTELVDWRCNQSFRADPNGESWIGLAYYTKLQSPEPFEAANVVAKLAVDKGRRYRQFFASLP